MRPASSIMLRRVGARALYRGRSPLLTPYRSCHAGAEAVDSGDSAARVMRSGGELTPKVGRLVDELVGLNMLEVKALTKELRNRLGIPEGGAMPMMNPAMFAGMAAPGAGPGAAEEAAPEKAPEKMDFNIKLEKFEAPKKIAVIKEVRALTSLGLKEAKELVEGAPKVIKEAVPKEEAEKIREKLVSLGATIVLE